MEGEVQRTKAAYNEALQNLEKISDEIHKLREDQKVNNFHEEVRKLIYYKRVHKRPRNVITFNFFSNLHRTFHIGNQQHSLATKHIYAIKIACLMIMSL